MIWSKWLKLSKQNIKNLPKKTGVYQISYPKKIPRLLTVDKEGILMIGHTGETLKNRINEFFKAVTKNTGGHSEGIRFWMLRLEDFLKPAKLRVRSRITRDKNQARKLENKLLKEYQDKYGELPPLNSSGGY